MKSLPTKQGKHLVRSAGKTKKKGRRSDSIRFQIPVAHFVQMSREPRRTETTKKNKQTKQVGRWNFGRTVIVVAGQILFVDEEVVILVELPELAVDDVKVFVAEEVGDLVDVVLLLEQADRGQQIRVAQLAQADLARPRPVHVVENPRYHLRICISMNNNQCQSRVMTSRPAKPTHHYHHSMANNKASRYQM